MPKVQTMLPKEEIEKGQGKLSKKSTPFFVKWFGWGKTSEKPSIQSVSTAYCRTHAFYNVLGVDYREWFEAYETEKGTWNVLKKSRRPYFATEINLDAENQDSSQDFHYESQALRKGVSFLDALMVLRQCEEGLIALETAKIKRKPHHHYSDVLKEEGLVWDPKNNKFIFIDEGERQTKESDEKINQKIVFASLKEAGRDLENANTDKNLSLYNFFEDPSYQKKVKESFEKAARLNSYLREISNSLTRIMGVSAVKIRQVEWAEPGEYEFDLPLLGSFDYTYDRGDVDRCVYQYGEGDYEWTGPFVTEAYANSTLCHLQEHLNFLPDEVKHAIRVFVYDAMFTASLLHLYNCKTVPMVKDKVDIKSMIAEEFIQKELERALLDLGVNDALKKKNRLLTTDPRNETLMDIPQHFEKFVMNLTQSIEEDHQKKENKKIKTNVPVQSI